MSFKAVEAKIARKEGISKDRAGAELAAGARKADAKAIRKNPDLLKVSGVAQEHPDLARSLKRHAGIVGAKRSQRA